MFPRLRAGVSASGISTSIFFVVKDATDGTVPPAPDDTGLDNPCAPVAAAPDPCPPHRQGQEEEEEEEVDASPTDKDRP